jgi:hypothetical protein
MSLILLIQAGRAGMEPIRHVWAHLRKMGLF